MKILYSQIKELVPRLKAGAKEVADLLTLIGFMNDSFEEVQYQNKRDYLLGIEVRQNRADCLSVMGLAKEIAVYYGLALELPKVCEECFAAALGRVGGVGGVGGVGRVGGVGGVGGVGKTETGALLAARSLEGSLDIKVKDNAKNYVKRILAVRIKELKNRQSPEWLKELLSLSEINSVNLLVDLSNYVMLLTGYSSHLLDADKIYGKLSWSLNSDFDEMTTLDGSNIKLNKDELIIRDDKNILALAGIVGGKSAEIDLSTTSIIAEMAIYDSSIVRRNSRSLKIRTEASNRLGKEIDPNGSEFAIKLLISLIMENCGGVIVSELFDFYPQKYVPAEIEFDAKLPGLYAGIDIPEAKCLEILKDLGCGIKRLKGKLMIAPPSGRMDISLAEDLIEEVIRIFGYEKIPFDEIPKLAVVKDITPKNIYLAEKIRDILSVLGFDEIFSWPLVRRGENAKSNYLDWGIVSTENSLNEDFPEMRQSLAISLNNQLQEYLKKNIEYIKIFEIGKVFGKKGNNYEEGEALGILMLTRAFSPDNGLSAMKETVERLLRIIGFTDIVYRKARIRPQISNPYSCWDIITGGEALGIFYKLRPERPSQNVYFSELNFAAMTRRLEKVHQVQGTTAELTQKLVVLDANVELKKDEFMDDFLAEIKKKIKSENLWSVAIIDKFSLKEKDRYTIRVAYKELSDNEAKKMHFQVFNLKQ